MIEDEGIRTEDAGSCLLCGEEDLLYHRLSDRLFGVPGIWSLVQCPPNCQLVCLNSRPLLEEVEKLYSQDYTRNVLEAPKKSLVSIRKKIKASVLQSRFSYQIDGASMIFGSLFSRIGPIGRVAGTLAQAEGSGISDNREWIFLQKGNGRGPGAGGKETRKKTRKHDEGARI